MHLQVLFHNPVLIFWGFFCSILADFVDVSGIFVFGSFFFLIFHFHFHFFANPGYAAGSKHSRILHCWGFFFVVFFCLNYCNNIKKQIFPPSHESVQAKEGMQRGRSSKIPGISGILGTSGISQAPHPIEKGISRTKIQIFLVAFYFLFQPFGDEGLGEDPLAL